MSDLTTATTDRRMDKPGPGPHFDTSDWECRICGCWDLAACPGGCQWLAKNVCSAPDCVAAAVPQLLLDAVEHLTDDHVRRHLEAWLQAWATVDDLEKRVDDATWLLQRAAGLIQHLRRQAGRVVS